MRTLFTPVAELAQAERQQLFRLLSRHFAGVTPEGFSADLAGKDRVLRLLDGQRLVGFTTLAYQTTLWRQERIGVIHSGDTIVDPAFWDGNHLAPAWITAVRKLHAGQGPLYWLLIASGPRTWRLLTRLFLAPPPSDDLTALLRHLATQRYRQAFDARSGVVRLAAPQRLRPHLAVVPEHLLRDPAVADFLHRNPGWRAGDELVGCARIDRDQDLTRLGRRMVAMGRTIAQDGSGA